MNIEYLYMSVLYFGLRTVKSVSDLRIKFYNNLKFDYYIKVTTTEACKNLALTFSPINDLIIKWFCIGFSEK